jgi:AcrR family transcriptional regulator
MRGRVPARSPHEIAAVATRVFTDKGYRATGISDVAAGLGLSHGALYTYVRSKEALFYLALLHAVRPQALDDLAVPVAAPPPERLVELAQGWAEAGFPALTAVSTRRSRPVDEELGEIIDELYGFIERNRETLALIERCAADLPDLAQLYFVRQRRSLIDQLGDYLRRRIRSGRLRPVPDVPTSARFIVETIAWFAWHRIGDPDSAMLDDDSCRATVRHLLLAAFLPAATTPATRTP